MSTTLSYGLLALDQCFVGVYVGNVGMAECTCGLLMGHIDLRIGHLGTFEPGKLHGPIPHVVGSKVQSWIQQHLEWDHVVCCPLERLATDWQALCCQLRCMQKCCQLLRTYRKGDWSPAPSTECRECLLLLESKGAEEVELPNAASPAPSSRAFDFNNGDVADAWWHSLFHKHLLFHTCFYKNSFPFVHQRRYAGNGHVRPWQSVVMSSSCVCAVSNILVMAIGCWLCYLKVSFLPGCLSLSIAPSTLLALMICPSCRRLVELFVFDGVCGGFIESKLEPKWWERCRGGRVAMVHLWVVKAWSHLLHIVCLAHGSIHTAHWQLWALAHGQCSHTDLGAVVPVQMFFPFFGNWARKDEGRGRTHGHPRCWERSCCGCCCVYGQLSFQHFSAHPRLSLKLETSSHWAWLLALGTLKGWWATSLCPVSPAKLCGGSFLSPQFLTNSIPQSEVLAQLIQKRGENAAKFCCLFLCTSSSYFQGKWPQDTSQKKSSTCSTGHRIKFFTAATLGTGVTNSFKSSSLVVCCSV